MRPKQYALSEAVSASEIKNLLTGTPYSFHFHKYVDDNNSKSDALIMGSYLHCLWLEPEHIEERYFVVPWSNNNTKSGKLQNEVNAQKFIDAAINNPDLTPICSRLVEKSQGIYNQLKDHPIIKTFTSLKDKIVETPIYRAQSPIDGVFIKCIPDLVSPEYGLVVDFKHMEDITPEKFQRDIKTYNYHVQAVLNMMCVSAEHNIPIDEITFEFVCISKKEPHECVRYVLDQRWIDTAYEDIMWALQEYKECLDNDQFPSYPSDAVTIECPAWVKSKISK